MLRRSAVPGEAHADLKDFRTLMRFDLLNDTYIFCKKPSFGSGLKKRQAGQVATRVPSATLLHSSSAEKNALPSATGQSAVKQA